MRRLFLVLLTTILILAGFVTAVCFMMFRGPSEDAGRLLALSCQETSALKFVPGLFYSEEELDALCSKKDDFVPLPVFQERDRQEKEAEAVCVETSAPAEEIEIIEIKEAMYKGKLMIVHDPSRIRIVSLDSFGEKGIYLTDFIEKYDAVGGTNAGGFVDPGGKGTGGNPDGVVIRDGEIVYGSENTFYRDVIGFDSDGVLHVGNMKGRQALECGIVDGCSFSAGPVLIEDGVKNVNLGGGINPRTAIGQTEDGSVLLLVLEGRHPDSFGATYDDLANIMEKYGAVNAGNFDGGSSSMFYYNGEQITKGCSLVGSRRLCTAVLILKKDEEADE